MSTDDAERQQDSEENTPAVVEVKAFDLRVGAGGRLTIPEEKRERYGIEQGDYVDAVFTVESGAGNPDA